jgi:hypothetical protein
VRREKRLGSSAGAIPARITGRSIEVGPGDFTGDLGRIEVSGGPALEGNPGEAGVVTLSVVPEPSGLMLLGIGAVGLLVCAARRRSRPRA